MGLKNKKSARLLTALVVALLLAIALLARWWSDGAVPAAPETLFEAAQNTRAIERLRASRLDQQPLIEFVEAVNRHLQEAEAVPFSNPPEAMRELVRLEQNLARMGAVHGKLLEDTAAAGSPDWLQRFEAFDREATQAYEDARDWCRVYTSGNLEKLGFRALLDLVVTGKDRSAALPDFPPWRLRHEFFRNQYLAFEQAYRLRNEQDPAIIRARLIEPGPAPIRWFYARLFEARWPIPPDFCTDTLLQEADRLSALREELHAADPLEELVLWTFPTNRRDNLMRLSSMMQPLQEAASVSLWLERWRGAESERTLFDRETSAAGPKSDPPLRSHFNESQTLVRSVELAYARAEAADELEAWRAFADFVDGSLMEQVICPCLFAPLLRLRDDGARLRRAEEELSTVKVEADAAVFTRAFGNLRLAAEAFSNALGQDLVDPLLISALDAWAAQRWPGWDAAREFSDRLEKLVKRGLWPDPRLASFSSYLALVADARTAEEVREQMQHWSQTLRTSLSDYPRLQKRIDAALLLRRNQWILAEIQSLVDAREDDALRLYLETLGEGDSPDDLRALSDSALAILKLPERVHELRLDSLPDFAARNAHLLPDPPPEDSILHPLFEEHVQPLLNLAAEAARLPTLPSAQFSSALERVITARERITNLYPDWHGFDERAAGAVLASTKTFPLFDPEDLRQSARQVARVQAWNGLSLDTRSTLIQLQRLLAACSLFLTEDPCAPGFSDWLDQARPLQQRFAPEKPRLAGLLDAVQAGVDFCRAWEAAPNSFRQLSELHRHAETTALPILREHNLRAEGLMMRLDATGALLQRLRPIVEADIEVSHRPDSAASDLLPITQAYRSFAEEVAAEDPRLSRYANAQALFLLAGTEQISVVFAPDPEPPSTLRIDWARMQGAPESLGYGERWPRRGESALLWIELGTHRANLLAGSWRERDGSLRITPQEIGAASLPVVWRQEIRIGVTVWHSTSGERALLPEEDRSRWNPLNYGLFKVEPHDYKLSTHSSLHGLLRELRASAEGDEYRIQLDPVLQKRPPSPDAAQWLLSVHEVPPGRDLDWPEVFTPLTNEEAEALGREMRQALENWMQDGQPPWLDLLP